MWSQFENALLNVLLVVSPTYDQRIKILGILSLEQLRFFNDIEFVFKCIRDFYKLSFFRHQHFSAAGHYERSKCVFNNAAG